MVHEEPLWRAVFPIVAARDDDGREWIRGVAEEKGDHGEKSAPPRGGDLVESVREVTSD